jgi:acetate CoA/acetoacetate CoA-transferase alpha subunit
MHTPGSLMQIKARCSSHFKLSDGHKRCVRADRSFQHETRFHRRSRRDDPQWRDHHGRRFHGRGNAGRLLDELVRQKKSELTIIANDAAIPGKGIGKLFDASLVANLTASHIGLNPKVQDQMMAKKVTVQLVPQGTLVERIRAGGSGLGGVLTPTGAGTVVQEGKRQIEIDGKHFLLETALRSQFALVHAFLADYLGNLSYALTARNFNPVMAMAADTVIVTAEHIVPVGVIAPDHVMTPAPLVDYLIANG